MNTRGFFLARKTNLQDQAKPEQLMIFRGRCITDIGLPQKIGKIALCECNLFTVGMLTTFYIKIFVLYFYLYYLCILKHLNMQKKTIETLLKESRLDWSVRTEGVKTESGILIPGSKSIIRDDTNVPLSIRSDDYGVYQNEQLMELLFKVSNSTGFEVCNGGYFGDGEKVFIQLKSDNLTLGNDRVEGYITGVNSFDGSTSLAFGPSNITISCQNSFFSAFRGLQTRVRHTKKMIIKIEDICKDLERVKEEENFIFDNIKKLREVRINNKIQDSVIKTLFNIDKEIDLQDEESISTQTMNKLSTFYVDLDGELRGKGDNLWGLFSGVTKYTTHSLTKNDNTEKKMFGTYGNRERMIFNELVELVN